MNQGLDLLTVLVASSVSCGGSSAGRRTFLILPCCGPSNLSCYFNLICYLTHSESFVLCFDCYYNVWCSGKYIELGSLRVGSPWPHWLGGCLVWLMDCAHPFKSQRDTRDLLQGLHCMSVNTYSVPLCGQILHVKQFETLQGRNFCKTLDLSIRCFTVLSVLSQLLPHLPDTFGNWGSVTCSWKQN